MNDQHKYDLEEMIDRYGVDTVLTALAEICGEKADHLRSNWQDEAAADEWEGRVGKLEELADKI